jgi:hypothetical protein
MRYLEIRNKGELDVRLISLMGGSTKSNDVYKIGQFGTGLKYSLSYLIRNNIDFKIFVGGQEVKIRTKRECIQDTDFDILYINDERTSITSSMGKDWAAWMILREIWCNALDEGNASFREVDDDFTGVEGHTTFYIQLTGPMREAFDKWDDYFIHNQKPLQSDESFAIYPSKGKLRIYKQGVLIHEEKEYLGVYAYDIKNAQINELREYKGFLTMDIVNLIAKLNKNLVQNFVGSVNEKHFEHGMDYDWSSADFRSEKAGWTEAMEGVKIIAKEDLRSFKERGVEIDEAKLVPVPKSLYNKLSQTFEGVSALRRSEKVGAFHEQIDTVAQQKFDQAMIMLEDCGYEVDPELKWIFGVFGDKNVQGRINTDTKEVFMSTDLKRATMFEMITTIIEENEHFKTGFSDCSRSFQQHFINLYAKNLLEAKKITL